MAFAALAAIGTMLVMDAAWLALMTPSYRAVTEAIQKEPMTVCMPAVIAAYACMALGFVFLVLPLAMKQESVWGAVGIGALYGFVLYGTYDFTNKAILKDFTWTIAAIDVLWGTLLMSVVTAVAYSTASVSTRPSMPPPPLQMR